MIVLTEMPLDEFVSVIRHWESRGRHRWSHYSIPMKSISWDSHPTTSSYSSDETQSHGKPGLISSAAAQRIACEVLERCSDAVVRGEKKQRGGFIALIFK